NKYGIHITGDTNTVMGNTTWDPNGQMAKGTALTGTADGNVVIPGASTAAHLNTASGTNVVITS
ncbi:hypothetical protein, partial [Streptococcus pneumoniae]|uniref:hypothetical protein n=1 Tax=Streptococcus pneumoniae TaxID=1313 RepID=UPI0018B0CB5C